MTSSLEELRAAKKTPRMCACGNNPIEVYLQVRIAEKREAGGSLTLLKSKQVSLCASCAVDRFTVATS